LPGRHFEPLAAPDALHPLVIHQPPGTAQQSGDLAIAVAAVVAGQRDQIGGELRFVLSAPRPFALCRAMLAERPAGAALGDLQGQLDLIDTGTPARGA
jgi:hypothetical protein